MTTTRRPDAERRCAQASPITPAPTMATSQLTMTFEYTSSFSMAASKRSSKEKQALETLIELTQLLTDSRPLEESLAAVTDAALRIVPAEHASIRLLDATHTELL